MAAQTIASYEHNGTFVRTSYHPSTRIYVVQVINGTGPMKDDWMTAETKEIALKYHRAMSNRVARWMADEYAKFAQAEREAFAACPEGTRAREDAAAWGGQS